MLKIIQNGKELPPLFSEHGCPMYPMWNDYGSNEILKRDLYIVICNKNDFFREETEVLVTIKAFSLKGIERLMEDCNMDIVKNLAQKFIESLSEEKKDKDINNIERIECMISFPFKDDFNLNLLDTCRWCLT